LNTLRTIPRALAFAARNLARQPGRAAVGILGIAAVGALLFDMLLLSRGLVVSFRDLLNGVGYDVRVLTSDAGPIGGPRLKNAGAIARELAALPEIAEVVPVRVVDAEADVSRAVGFTITAMEPQRTRPWTLIAGSDDLTPAPPVAQDSNVAQGSGVAQGFSPANADQLLVNRHLAEALRAGAGAIVSVRVSCAPGRAALPAQPFRVAGIADFPFDNASQLTAVASPPAVRRACGEAEADAAADEADLLLIASREDYGADAAVAAIRRVRPDLKAATNEEIVMRMQRQGFTYFRQISTVLSTITMLFGFLLITVLLTVSVNQRLGEIAALRALGFSRARAAADVCCQSALLVGIGGALAVPLGFALSLWLDRILKAMPGIPEALHFFVFEPRAIALHAVLLAATSLLAAAYPVRLVTTLPIAATLRNEVVG
jgi:putative ABC transport system permease protein